MEVSKKTSKKIYLELTPLEAEVIYEGLKKEDKFRTRKWNLSQPVYPEEIIFNGSMKMISSELKSDFAEIIKK